MKKLKCTDRLQCKTCYQCMNSCSLAFYKEADVTKSCIVIGEKPDATPAVNVCIQCGKCAKVCEAGAITQNAKGVYLLNKKLCTKCGKCVDECPFNVIVRVGEEVPTKCIACGICVKECPMQILEIVEK